MGIRGNLREIKEITSEMSMYIEKDEKNITEVAYENLKNHLERLYDLIEICLEYIG